MKSDLLDLVLHKHAVTERAILVSDDSNSLKAVWLPLSQVEVESTKNPNTVIVTIPEWLAIEKELV